MDALEAAVDIVVVVLAVVVDVVDVVDKVDVVDVVDAADVVGVLDVVDVMDLVDAMDDLDVADVLSETGDVVGVAVVLVSPAPSVKVGVVATKDVAAKVVTEKYVVDVLDVAADSHGPSSCCAEQSEIPAAVTGLHLTGAPPGSQNDSESAGSTSPQDVGPPEAKGTIKSVDSS